MPLIDAREVANLVGCHVSSVWRLDKAGKMPKPIRISGGLVRWRSEDIREWIAMGCPDRDTFEAAKAELAFV